MPPTNTDAGSKDKNNVIGTYRLLRGSLAKIQKGFFKYVFVSRNTWILGRLKHIETTLIVLPKTIIEAIKGIMNIMRSNNPNRCL